MAAGRTAGKGLQPRYAEVAEQKGQKVAPESDGQHPKYYGWTDGEL